MRMTDLIEKKKSAQALSEAEIQWLIKAYVGGEVPDYQMSAFLMAVCFSSMNAKETAALTYAMMSSGDIIDLNDIKGVKVDKHSTGGVGDTTTLVVAPLVAASGGTVAKMSGRGLGHTGGTLDKLESIPGVNIDIPMDKFKDIVKKNGLCVMGQSGNLVPADKKMYALRDVTGTVKSIPLIASSIMSKKLAAGADAIVLDVKVGTGAFMQTVDEAKSLARAMVDIGKELDRRVVAVITDMNQPLGLAVGNALEVREAVQLLSGKIPQGDPLYEVCMILGSNMLICAGLADGENDAREKLTHSLESGAGLDKLKDMISAEGGDANYIDVKNVEELVKVKKHVEFKAKSSGNIVAMNASSIGEASRLLGAGRLSKEDVIDPAVGLVMHKRLGDAVKVDETIATLYVNDDKGVEDALRELHMGITVDRKRPDMVYEIVE